MAPLDRFRACRSEVRTVRERVGLCEISNFAKYSVKGEGAEAWLDRVLACKLPKPGRMTIAPMLKDDGRLIGDFTLANLGGEGEWFIAGSGIAEQYHMRWFEKHLPGDGSVAIEALGVKLCGLSIAGPKARQRACEGYAGGHVERGVSVHGDPPRSTSAWRRAWSGASATQAISATRSGWRRNTSGTSSRH